MEFFASYMDVISRPEFLDNCVFSLLQAVGYEQIVDLQELHQGEMVFLCPAQTRRSAVAFLNGILDMGIFDELELHEARDAAENFQAMDRQLNSAELAIRLAQSVAQHAVGPHAEEIGVLEKMDFFSRYMAVVSEEQFLNNFVFNRLQSVGAISMEATGRLHYIPTPFVLFSTNETCCTLISANNSLSLLFKFV